MEVVARRIREVSPRRKESKKLALWTFDAPRGASGAITRSYNSNKLLILRALWLFELKLERLNLTRSTRNRFSYFVLFLLSYLFIFSSSSFYLSAFLLLPLHHFLFLSFYHPLFLFSFLFPPFPYFIIFSPLPI